MILVNHSVVPYCINASSSKYFHGLLTAAKNPLSPDLTRSQVES
jgi:hypothetical protein